MLLFHHVLGIICMFHSLTMGYGSGLVIPCVIVEATAPFVNGRWFLDKIGWRSSTLYIINGAMITILWFLLRIVFMGWFLFQYVYVKWDELMGYNDISHVIVVLSGFVGGYGLQVIWFQKIVSGMMKILSTTKPKSKDDKKE